MKIKKSLLEDLNDKAPIQDVLITDLEKKLDWANKEKEHLSLAIENLKLLENDNHNS